MLRVPRVTTNQLVILSMAAGVLLTLHSDLQHYSFTRTREALTSGGGLPGGGVPAFTLSALNHTHHPGRQKVRVLCWVMTRPEMHYRAMHVKATWGSRCDRLIFMSSHNDTELGAINLGVGEGRGELWSKSRAAYTHVYHHYLSQYDWFYKADDDTYAVMENMRYMLAAYDPNYPIYFGSRFRYIDKQSFMGGGAGYVLSRQAVKMFVEEALRNETLCDATDSQGDDLMMGRCLENIGVVSGDSRDSRGRGRFFQLDLPRLLYNNEASAWHNRLSYYTYRTGLDCCSDSAIAFHRISPRKMYEMEYLLYHLRPHTLPTPTTLQGHPPGTLPPQASLGRM